MKTPNKQLWYTSLIMGMTSFVRCTASDKASNVSHRSAVGASILKVDWRNVRGKGIHGIILSTSRNYLNVELTEGKPQSHPQGTCSDPASNSERLVKAIKRHFSEDDADVIFSAAETYYINETDPTVRGFRQ